MLPCVQTNQGMKKTWVLECSAEGWNPSQIPPSKKEIHVGLSPKNGPNSCSSSMLIIILPTEKARKGCPKKTNHVLFLYSSLFRLPTWWSVAVCQSGSWSAQAGEEGTSSHSQTRAQVETCQLHPASSCTRSNKMAVCHFNLKICSFFEKDSVVRSFMHILGRVAVARAQKTHY
jgi:hypothetical protein